jgi:hypothetical protein
MAIELFSEGLAQEPGAGPEVSFVLPAMNESLNIEECIDWCLEGLATAGVCGEILIVDSSSDATAELALAKGARVVRTERPGLGQAYIEALPFIRGRFVIMGDCDCTYDFRALAPFVAAFRAGAEFVMGSRFLGSIESGAMPAHHQYFGTPLTTWILNWIFSSRFSDIHCGMRGITLAALRRMNITSTSWEYASEMVIKSVHMGLVTAQVPVHFYKDRKGRLSHHRRMGWWSPWAAGWINLRAMFVHGGTFFLVKPGMVFLASGLLLLIPLAGGAITVGPITFSLFWMLLGLVLAVVGLQCLHMGSLSRLFFDYSGERTQRWVRRFPYNRMVGVSFISFLAGLAVEAAFLASYVRSGYLLGLTGSRPQVHLAVLGLFLLIFGFMNFTYCLTMNGFILSVKGKVHSGRE